MPFSGNINQEIRLTFSKYAEDVISNDMLVFPLVKENKQITRSTFINTVIRNFYPIADASISLRLEEYEDKLINILGNKASKNILSLLLKAEQQRLEDIANSYDRPEKSSTRSPLRLQNDIFHYLTGEGGTRENFFNNYTMTGYLRTLMEEYTRLPYKRSERIYYIQKYQALEHAILTKKQLLLTVSSGRQFHVLPYTIMEDPLGTASYLVGFSYETTSDKTAKRPCSFRIASLQDFRIENSKSGYLHPADIQLLKKKLADNGVQFLISDTVTITVKLSQQGIDKFNHQLTLRPTPIHTDKETGIYTFNCSKTQAEFYFFKFGRDVEILSPEDLRDRFKEGYSDAYHNYVI